MNSLVKLSPLWITLVGVTAFYSHFTKIKVGPIFITEALFSFWVVSVLLTQPRSLLDSTQKVFLAVLFFIWGLGLFIKDAIQEPLTLRTIQHAVLFVYPAMWMCAGAWTMRFHKEWVGLIVISVIGANVIANILGQPVLNYSIGPLSAILLIMCLNQFLRTKRPILCIAVIGLTIMTFFPVWSWWYVGRMKRTGLLELLVFLVLTPWLISNKKKITSDSCRRILQTALMLLVLCFGILATSFMKHRSSSEQVSSQFSNVVRGDFFESMQAYEDVPYSKEEPRFQARSRKLWWTSALKQWEAHPIIGIGFISEVPTHFLPHVENTVEGMRSLKNIFHDLRESPLSGPHNSYLSILTRMGLVGLGIFFLIAIMWFRKVLFLDRNWQFPFLILIPVAGALHAAVNIGFEAPHNCILFWFFLGFPFGI